jgi:hypothetical protein
MLFLPVLAVLGMRNPRARCTALGARAPPGLRFREGVTQREKVWRDRRGSMDSNEERVLMTSATRSEAMAL